MNKVERLIHDYIADSLSLSEFQSRLRPLLGDCQYRSPEDDEFINWVDNQIELVLYTIPKDRQKDEVTKLFPAVTDFALSKASERQTSALPIKDC